MTSSADNDLLILGIDIGSVAVAVAALTFDRQIVATGYAFHHGEITATVEDLLSELDLSGLAAVAATHTTPDLVDADGRCDDQVAVITAAGHLHPRVGSILFVGGEKFGLHLFDEDDRYAGLRTNTSCAAGTGSFLDQQADRLNLSGIGELSATAAANAGSLPKIASRCAVFAKTDLIHAQQEGYRLEEICDGLCRGLARNIVDTVCKHEQPRRPIIFCGGVARNPAVVNHISRMVGTGLVVDEHAPLYGAIGAALRLLGEHKLTAGTAPRQRPVLRPRDEEKTYGHGPLRLKQSDFPDFSAAASLYHPQRQERSAPIEMDLYEDLPAGSCPVYLGLDIGSTSTKAVWMRPDKTVLAGFYTRTAGQPVAAVQSLLEAMDDLAGRHDLDLEIRGAGTTGSGRKFAGTLMGADRILDEITAHARAAVELNPAVDTIIEIGGQDSKFTTLRHGQVTFSIMNTVCAAGTGSFLEEQAEKLGLPLSAYAERTIGVQSPVTSDRCTVFMERDINYFLSRGYQLEEVLTAALRAVCENYLTKVTVESGIGETVCFQGATAKNRSLVAAFEQRLGRPIHVSRFCHLTGALGAALHLVDEAVTESTFRGLDLYRRQIPVRSEVCDLCPNHCKITVADLDEGPVAFGFLCGRDYDTRQYVDNNRSGFDLVRTHGRVLRPDRSPPENPAVTVGIPAALYLHEDVALWTDFFHRLGLGTVVSRGRADDVLQRGKARVGAEFCAPLTALHGHVDRLLEQADYVFLPYYLDNRQKDGDARRQYCYYSQFAPTLMTDMAPDEKARIISPIFKFLYNGFQQRRALLRAVRQIDHDAGFFEVMSAYERAVDFQEKARQQWRRTLDAEMETAADVCVLFLGRPYTVLDPVINKNIPRIFGTLGVKGFFQDMLDLDRVNTADIAPFLDELHWNYAADIIKAARVAAETPNLYPVLMTAFKCSPDSFIRDVFQSLMAAAGKPYLILELDEHGSSVGYETRIESAVRSFRNHAAARKVPAGRPDRINPAPCPGLAGKTLVLPNWDPVTCRFLAANLRREGIDTHLMEETPDAIKRSMRLNSGQCLPINIIVQEFVEHVRTHDLDPARTLLWAGDSQIPCNIRLYPYKLKQMMDGFGEDMRQAAVYTGIITFTDISMRAAANGYFAFMFGGLLRRLVCRVRPYEKVAGAADQALEEAICILEAAFAGERPKEAAVIEAVGRFAQIPTIPGRRPQVAIFGDLYVRDNPVFNQDLIGLIERHGGEALTTPYNDYAKMIAPAYFKKWFTEGKYLEVMVNRGLLAAMRQWEKIYYRHFQRVLDEPEPAYDLSPEAILAEFGMIPEHTGESMDNILKICYLCRHHPDLALFVQTSPAFCCPSLITEAMAETIEARTGVPMVSVTYDGTGGEKNRKIIPYLNYIQQSTAAPKKAGQG
ncbi:MAG: acyl-CoA dehydratase activase [Desulfosudaceae bacterium]